MPSQRELATESIAKLQNLLTQLDLVCRQAAELQAEINAQMRDRARAFRPAVSDAPTPRRRPTKRKTG
jgi:hypothetical protein